jgi:hypothetical protein
MSLVNRMRTGHIYLPQVRKDIIFFIFTYFFGFWFSSVLLPGVLLPGVLLPDVLLTGYL